MEHWTGGETLSHSWSLWDCTRGLNPLLGAPLLNTIGVDTCNLGVTQTTILWHVCDLLSPGQAMLWGFGRSGGVWLPISTRVTPVGS